MADAKIVLSATDSTKGAFDSVLGGLNKLQLSALSVTGVLETLGVTLSAGFFAGLVKGSIDGADHLNDLSKSTNLAVEDLAGLQLLAKQSGTDLDGLAKGINRMTVEIGKSPEKFRNLGVTAKDGVGALKQVSDIFNRLTDTSQRNALANAVFGKSWAELAPILSEGGQKIGETIDKGARLSGITTDMAKASDEFNDKLAELTGTHGLMNRQVATLLPLLNTLAGDLVDLQDKTSGADDGFHPLAETLRALIVLGGNVSFVFQGVGRDIGAIAAQAAALASGNLKGALDIGNAAKEDAKQARDAFDQWEQKIVSVGTSLKATGDVSDAISRRVAANSKTEQDAAAARAAAFLKWQDNSKAEEEEYRKITKGLDERVAAGKKELELGRQLTDAEKLEAKVLAEVKDAKVALTSQHGKAILSELDEAKAVLTLLDVRKKQRDAYVAETQADLATQAEIDAATAAAADSYKGLVLGIDDQAQALADSNTQLKLEASLIGASDQEREVALGNLKVDLDLKRQEEQLNKNLLLTEQQRQQQRQRLRDNADEEKSQVSQRAAMNEFQRQWQTIDGAAHDAFISIGTGGKNTFQQLGKTLQTAVLDQLYQLTLKKWIVNISASVSDSLGGGGSSLWGALSGLGGVSDTAYGSTSFADAFAGGTIAMHSGGIVGREATFTRAVDPSVFDGARKYHSGGLVEGEVPAILKRGEGVFTPEQMKALGGSGGAGRPAVTIVNNMTVGDVASMAQVQEQLRASERRSVAALRRSSAYGGSLV